MMQPSATPVNVFLYLRTSTDEQDESPIIQEKRAREFCDKKGWTVVDVYYEIASGTTPIERRPQFQKMLVDAPMHHVHGFVGLAFNRFLRSIEVKTDMVRRLRQQRLFVWGIDDNLQMGCVPGRRRQSSGDKMNLDMRVVVDEYYANFIADKIVDHHEHRVALKMHHSGAPPFGYKPQKDLYRIEGRYYDGWAPDDTPDGSQDGMTLADRYRWIVDRFVKTENMMGIAVELTQMGVPTPRLVQWNRLANSEQDRRLEVQRKNRDAGHQTRQLPPSPMWDSSVLSDMLRSETYLGRIAYTPEHLKSPGRKSEKVWQEGRHEPLISPEKFAQVQAILERVGQANRKAATKRTDALLNGMLICTCGHALTFTAKDRLGQKICYVCNYRKKSRGLACQMKQLNARAVDKVVFDLLMRGIKVRLLEIRAAVPLVVDAPQTDDLERELVDLRAKRERILENYEDGAYGTGAEAKAKRDAKLDPVLKRIAEIEKIMVPVQLPQVDELAQALVNIRDLWPTWPTYVKRDILRTYVPEGFKVLEGRVIRAEVCGVLLEADVPVQESPKPGMRYGGRQKKAEKSQDRQQLEALLAVSVSSPHVSGGKGRSGGMVKLDCTQVATSLQELVHRLLLAS